ncbi:hypothetical protein Tcan_01044, partial [Toxocara canis]
SILRYITELQWALENCSSEDNYSLPSLFSFWLFSLTKHCKAQYGDDCFTAQDQNDDATTTIQYISLQTICRRNLNATRYKLYLAETKEKKAEHLWQKMHVTEEKKFRKKKCLSGMPKTANNTERLKIGHEGKCILEQHLSVPNLKWLNKSKK